MFSVFTSSLIQGFCSESVAFSFGVCVGGGD